MTDLDEHTPSSGEPPPAGLDTPTTPNPKSVPDSFTNLTSNPSNPTTIQPTHPSSSNYFSSYEKPWRCVECPAVSTPLRRRGPQGRKTLCNACGIRYGKRRKAVREANGTNNNTNQQRLRVRNRAQRVTTQLPPENEAAVRERVGNASGSSKRRRLERLPKGQYHTAQSPRAAAPVVSQNGTDHHPGSLNTGIGGTSTLTAAIAQGPTTLTLTEDANPTRAEHLTLTRMEAGGLAMTPEPRITSPPMSALSALSAYPREPFANQPTLGDQAALIGKPTFFAPGEQTGTAFESGDNAMGSAIIREDAESGKFAGMPSPASMYQLTPTRLEGEPMQATLQYVGDGATWLHRDQKTNSNEEIPIAREMNTAILGCSQLSGSQANEMMSLLEGQVRWSDDFARGYGVTVPATTQENIQTGDTQEEGMTSVGAGAAEYPQRFGNGVRERLVMRCTATLSRLQGMSERITRDISSLNESLTRFAKKNEELAVVRQRNLALIEQLTNEKTMASTKQKLLWHDIAKAHCLLEHLRKQELGSP